MSKTQHRARKRFGQNFLSDAGIIQKIHSAIGASADDHIIEIGPGQGALTDALVNSAGRIDLIELDRDLAAPLQERYQDVAHCRVHQQDALKADFSALADGQALRVVGNLPYNISTPLIFHLLNYRHHIRDMHFMLQREVVERLAAGPGGGQWGRLSIMTQLYCHVDGLFDVPPEAFNPRPKVMSAVVRLRIRPDVDIDPQVHTDLDNLVRAAFGQRRKTLRNGLKQLMSSEEIENAGVDPSQRPEQLSLAEFLNLAQHYRQQQTTTG